MKISFIVILSFIISCQFKKDKNILLNKSTNDTILKIEKNTLDTPQLQEIFIDSLNIGRKKYNKVEVLKYYTKDSDFVDIKFFAIKLNQWKLIQRIHFIKDDISGCDTKLNDFNNDRFNDLTIISATAARGANEVRKLFIYNNDADKLIEIINAENYPNMLYNKELNCIDAFMVYGGSSTVFLRISGNSLKEFARVEASEGLTITEYDKYGKENILYKDTTTKAVYTRYKSYKPLKKYKGDGFY